MRFLITGARGQLAREFIEYFENNGIEYKAFSKEELDVTDFKKVYEVLKEVKPDVVINCSAYNQVDRAESEPYLAYKVNALGFIIFPWLLKKLEQSLFIIPRIMFLMEKSLDFIPKRMSQIH